MLLQVLIYQQVHRLFFSQFGRVLGEEVFNNILKILQKDARIMSRDLDKLGSYDFFKYRVSYLVVPDKDLLFILVTDLTDTAANVKEQLLACKNEFFAMFGEVLDQQFDPETFAFFHSAAEKIHKALRPKISLVGYSGVGKTTITKLIKAEEIPMEHVPTITGDIGTIQIGKLSFCLWDFAGQEQFDFLWNKFVQGSDAVLVITDSTIKNVDKSRYFLDLVKEEAPHAHVAVIANKQDLPGAMPVIEVERMMAGTHAFGMVAVDPANRKKMIALVADILEMSAEVSPLLKPLMDRDRKESEAEQALLTSDFQRARQLFAELSDLTLELGDDSRAFEFRAYAERVAQSLTQP